MGSWSLREPVNLLEQHKVYGIPHRPKKLSKSRKDGAIQASSAETEMIQKNVAQIFAKSAGFKEIKTAPKDIKTAPITT